MSNKPACSTDGNGNIPTGIPPSLGKYNVFHYVGKYTRRSELKSRVTHFYQTDPNKLTLIHSHLFGANLGRLKGRQPAWRLISSQSESMAYSSFSQMSCCYFTGVLFKRTKLYRGKLCPCNNAGGTSVPSHQSQHTLTPSCILPTQQVKDLISSGLKILFPTRRWYYIRSSTRTILKL